MRSTSIGFAFVIAMFAACGPKAATPAPPPTPPPPSPGDTPPPPAFDVTQLGQPCSDKCVAPAKCEQYSGIAGPKGPQFTSCELRCGDAKACPDGTTCVTVADGPGEVCRPVAN